ncbi:MAG: thioredoxin-disulfide reductase [Chloroflexi bacterium]|nr:thioredoxin-disulfide reductase [Chloroflexota bacterium]
MAKEYDLVIIGAGPGGLSAGLYAARSRLKCVALEKRVPGGQITDTERVDNYPGFPDGVLGVELGQLMHQQAERAGMEMEYAEVTSLTLEGNSKRVATTEGGYLAKAVIITSGANPMKLGVPGESEFTGRGVSYCSVCDGPFFTGKPIAVVGGGDSAVEEGDYLTRFASQVTLVHRRDELRATKVLQERAFSNKKMDFRWNTVVEAIRGSSVVSALELRDVKTGQKATLEVPAVFIYVGLRPNIEFLNGLIKLDSGGHIAVNLWMETQVPGIFAAGDVRCNSAKQVVSAAGDGATAAIAAERYIKEWRP